ncbi:MAG: dipicolinate synthase subunit DpsA [Spirochaetaceae bacterium]
MKILIIAGDLTNYYLYKTLLENKHKVTLEGFDYLTKKIPKKSIKLKGYNTVICPIPFTIDNSTLYSPYSYDNIHIDHLLERVDSDARIIGGPFNFHDNRLYDLTKNRTFTDMTVIPACEEVIKIIIDKSDITINNANIAIIGSGRISLHLIKLLKLLGGNITTDLKVADFIINTIPKLNIDKKVLDTSKKSVLIIDVASNDGGIDYKYAKKIDINIIKARGLPGKSAPQTVSDYIYKTLSIEKLI